MLLSHLHFNNLRSLIHAQNACTVPLAYFETFSKQTIKKYFISLLNTLPSQIDSIYLSYVPNSKLHKEQEPETKHVISVITTFIDGTRSWIFKSLVPHNCSPSPYCSCSEHPCWAAGQRGGGSLPNCGNSEGRRADSPSPTLSGENWNTRLSSPAGHPDGERELSAALPPALLGRGRVRLRGGRLIGTTPLCCRKSERGDLWAGYIPIPPSRQFSLKVLIWALWACWIMNFTLRLKKKKKRGGSVAKAYQCPLAAEHALARAVYELLLFISVTLPSCCKSLGLD